MKNYIKIGKRKIGENYPPLIIVELGINHNGKIDLAKKIIKSAKKAGAEIIKNQTHIAEMEMSEEAKKIIPVHTKENIYKIINDCSLSENHELNLMKFIMNTSLKRPKSNLVDVPSAGFLFVRYIAL